jgi:hypothetical protein
VSSGYLASTPGAAAIAAMIAVLTLSACGATDKGAGNAARSTSSRGAMAAKGGAPHRGDEDGDTGKGYLDSDDPKIADFGHPANAAELDEVRSLIKYYYAAALAGDGAAACGLIDAAFKAAIPTDYGSNPSLAYAKGSTCTAVLTKIFQHFHGQLTTAFSVARVRVRGSEGFVLLSSNVRTASYFPLQREHGKWKLIGIMASPLV